MSSYFRDPHIHFIVLILNFDDLNISEKQNRWIWKWNIYKMSKLYFRNQLEKMLSKVKCEIMSTCHNTQVDAYVLSESSMFVSKRRFILKTCGITTPLECLLDLNKLVKIYSGFDTIEVFIWILIIRKIKLCDRFMVNTYPIYKFSFLLWL